MNSRHSHPLTFKLSNTHPGLTTRIGAAGGRKTKTTLDRGTGRHRTASQLFSSTIRARNDDKPHVDRDNLETETAKRLFDISCTMTSSCFKLSHCQKKSQSIIPSYTMTATTTPLCLTHTHSLSLVRRKKNGMIVIVACIRVTVVPGAMGYKRKSSCCDWTGCGSGVFRHAWT